MKKRHIQVVLVMVAVLALGAGLAAGFLTARLPTSPVDVPLESLDRTPLVEQLQLTAGQRDQMREIWESVRSQVRGAYDEAQKLQQQRDDALKELLNEEQQAKFAVISRDFSDRFNQVTDRRDKAFDSAVEQTKALLSIEQQRKYDQILKAHVGDAPRLGPTTNQ